ncbi:N-acetylmuramoyl-L-alanine amidase [Prevotella communis]|uniref:N-acetylmuramoyl-L-alanine amidase family protein n=1 Tax=Prevotella communis TaxID=2913614 RepID=UPI001EDC0D17|nr:N-acetylmuramoyl-L-alanine amidase [Prevotella communis]UKK61675.1 N-acetylmuramoyl-L-alanine amidase [Prevotella communis]UKK64501.1 N-acetylmuramoyl-L-alanine amidase [Prevotella communis]
MSRKFYVFLLLICCFAVTSFAAKRPFTLVIDAGHGGKDAGAPGKYSYEKNINLKVALAFGRYVEKNCPDVKVIYTRKTDVFIPLHERAAIANRNKADVFISIHTNSVASKKPISGLETYTMGMRRSGEKLSAAMRENDVILIEDNYQQHYSGFDPRSPESYIMFEVLNDKNMLESVELAKGIQKNVCRTANRPNKGVKQDAFLVLRETSMPACLIELGYITTPSEEAYLNAPSNQEAMGRGIYQAFVEYKARATHQPMPVKVEEPEVPEQSVKEEAPVKQEVQEAPVVPAETPEVAVKQNAPAKQEAPVKQEQPVQKKTSVKPAQPAKADTVKTVAVAAPVFKVQFLASNTRIKAGDARFKGLDGVDSYQEGGLWKYTVGSTESYAEVRQLRAQVVKVFPQAFIVAFKNGEKMDTQKAIRESQQKK